jgi:hypothetical protein
MVETASQSDLGFGLSIVFGLLAILAAATMYIAHADQLVAGGAFAFAMIAGSLAIAAVHLYG